MVVKVGINGFGRMGRLALRAALEREAYGQEFEVVHINEKLGTARSSAHLLQFDSVQGRLPYGVSVDDQDCVTIEHRGCTRTISWSNSTTIQGVDWVAMGIDVVLECTGSFKTRAALQPYVDAGVKKVLVSAPIKKDVLNLVYGVNEAEYTNHKQPQLVTAASCTTNCLAPVVQVIKDELGIQHGVITTIHNATNTQTVVDSLGHKDLRRDRSTLNALVPTTTGSATAIALIYPELKGKLNGVAVRVPMCNGSLLDCVFQVERDTSVQEVNDMLRKAAAADDRGILGVEELPLVSVDFTGDTRSAVVDMLSTMVVNKRMVKLLVWYDNEFGYVHRMVDIVQKLLMPTL